MDRAPDVVVSADDVLGLVRLHLDRVHDAVLRAGCPAGAAVRSVEAGAADLPAAARAGAPTAELVGQWYATSLALAVTARGSAVRPGALVAVGRSSEAARPVARLGSGPDPAATADLRPAPVGWGAPERGAPGPGLLGQGALVAGALDRCDERDRTALLLADTYDLPAEALGPALGLPVPDALRLVGRARLAVLPDLFEGDAPHGRCTADTAGLARLAAGGTDPVATRHLRACRACPDVVHAQQDVRDLLAGLPVAAVPDHEREPLLERLAGRARRELPVGAPAAAVTPVAAPRRPLVTAEALVWLAAAVLAGTALGVATARPAAPRTAPARVLAPVVAPPPPTLAAAGAPRAPQPVTTVFTYPPTPTPSPTSPPPSPSPAGPSPSPTAVGRLVVAPAAGPAGARLRVAGTGWPSGSTVAVVLLGPRGARTAASATVTADPGGAFAAVLTGWRTDAAAGVYAVVATSGPVSVTGTYTVVVP